jgi:hypothetical protein
MKDMSVAERRRTMASTCTCTCIIIILVHIFNECWEE